MAQQSSEDWFTISDKENELKADFPHRPLEMNFDIPFQNTPPQGRIRFYSFPLPEGTLILSIYHSKDVGQKSLKKNQFHDFFENTLVPRFFFDPLLFRNKQTYEYELQENNNSATFKFTYVDHEEKKKLEGVAKIKKDALYTFFYIASEKHFDREIFDRFINSIEL